MTLAERWVRDIGKQYLHLHAKYERGMWTVNFSDGKVRLNSDDFERFKMAVAAEKEKPPEITEEQLWGIMDAL